MKQKGFAPILIILIFAILGVVGYFVYKNNSTKPQALLVSSPSPSASTGSAENWKTYTNTKYNYSIQYPSNWIYREFPDTQSGAGFRLANDPNDLGHEHITVDFDERFSMDLDKSALQKLSFEEYVKHAALWETQEGYFLSLASVEKIVTSSSIVGYKTVWKIHPQGSSSGETALSSPITYFDTKDTSGDLIKIDTDSDYLDIYNKMLSTFKFTK